MPSSLSSTTRREPSTTPRAPSATPNAPSVTRRPAASRAFLAGVAVTALTGAIVGLPSRPALAQAIALSVNGDPVTSVDLEERMKLLRALHRPATRDAAIESMVSDRLKNHEASRFGITIKDNEIGEAVQRVAKKEKITTQQLQADLSKSGVTPAHYIGFFKAELGYYILVKALNKGVEASEITVRDELAKEKVKGAITNYTLRQVVFTIEPGGGPDAVTAAVKGATTLKERFTSCSTGIPYAKSLPGVAVREQLKRSSTDLGEGMKDILDKLPVGHVTAPSRSPNGIEVIALCDRSASRDDAELRKVISDRILDGHYEQVEREKYQEMRATAVIEKR